MTDDLDTVLDSYVPLRQRARAANQAASETSADEATKAITLAPQVGLPPSIVQYDLDGIAKRNQVEQNNALTDQNSRLAEFVSEPVKAAAAKDDYAALDTLSGFLDPGGVPGTIKSPTAEAFGKGVASGYSHQNYGRLAALYQAGVPGVEPALRGYEDEFAKEQKYAGFQRYVNALGGFFGTVGSSVQVAAPAAGVGAAVAGPPGAVAGFGMGFIGDLFASTSGSAYRTLDQVRDVNGQPLSEPIKQAASLAGGGVAATIGAVGGGVLGRVASRLTTEALTAALAEPGVAAAIGRGVTGTVGAGLTGGTINAGIALSQELTPILARKFSGQTFADDPKEYDRLVSNLKDAFVDGALLFGGLHTVPIGVNYLRDRQAIAQTELDAQQRLSILGAMQVPKVFQQSAEMAHEYIASHGYPDVSISAEEVAKHRDAFSYIPDLDEQLAKQTPIGGEITIPAADYFVKTPKEIVNGLNEKVRGISGLTPEEAQQLHETPERYLDVFHGSPHSFEAFDISKIGTGEGAQAYGHGLYFAEKRGIAEDYQERLSGGSKYTVNGEPFDETKPSHAASQLLKGNGGDVQRAIKEGYNLLEGGNASKEYAAVLEKALQLLEKTLEEVHPLTKERLPEGNLYTARINRPQEHFLDWDKPLEEQSTYVQEALKKTGFTEDTTFPSKTHGGDMHEWISQKTGGINEAALALEEAGIAGIKYADAGSRPDPALLKHLEDELPRVQERLDLTKESLENFNKNFPDYKQEIQIREMNVRAYEKQIADIQKRITDEKDKIENGTRNYVVFSDKDVQITHVNDVARQVEEALNRTTEQIMDSMNLSPRQHNRWLDPTLTPGAVGMPEAVFSRMSKNIQELQRSITKAAFDAAFREEARRQTPLWKSDLSRETTLARDEMERQPDWMAWEALHAPKDNPFSYRLNRNEVDALFNRESPADYAAFTKDGTRASEAFPDKMFAPDGLSPDAAAGFHGYSSGKELLDKLREHATNIRESGGSAKKYFDSLVEAEANRRMEEKHGLLKENILNEAIDHAISVKQVDVLIDEFKALGGDEKLTRERVEEYAKGLFDGLKAGDVKSKNFERLVAKYGEAAFRAANADKPVEAMKAKQNQLYQTVLMRLARDFEKEKGRLDKIVQRFGDKPAVSGIAQEFTDQAHLLFGNVDLPTAGRSAENIMESLKGVTFEDFRNKTLTETGREILDAPLIAPQNGVVPKFKDFTVAQMKQFSDTMTSLQAAGRFVEKANKLGEELAFRDVADQMVEHLAQMDREITDADRTAWQQTKIGGRLIDSSLIRMEQLFQWLDKNDPNGLFTTMIYRPLKASEFSFLDQWKSLADTFNKTVPFDKAWSRSLNNQIKNTLLMDSDGRPIMLYRDNLIAMALNMGTETNFRTLTKGRNWHPDDVAQVVKDNLTDKDRQVVQAIWKMTEDLWPQVRDLSRKKTGVAVEREAARDVDLGAGPVKGGYYPLMEEPQNKARFRDVQMDKPFLNFSTTSSATRARTGAVYPVDLNLDRLPYALRETLHDIHFYDAVSNAAKFTQDNLVREGISRAFGPEYVNQLDPWLHYIATDGGMPDPAALGWLTRGSRFLRQNMVTQLVGFRPSTALLHGGSALFNSLAEIAKDPSNAKYLGNTMDALFRNPTTLERYAKEWAQESGELRNRFHMLDRDFGAVVMRGLSPRSGLGKILGDAYDRAAYQTFATMHIAYLDYASALMVYGAKRAEALGKGMSLADSIYAAEQAVRQAHGSSGLLDLPAIARGNEAMKWFTTFYGYFNHNYNRLRDTGRFLKEADYKDPATYWQIVMRSMGYLVAPAILHEAIRHDRNKDDPIWKVAMKAGAQQVTGGVPIVRDAARGLLEGKKPDQISPLQEVMGGLVQSAVDINKFGKDKIAKDWVSHAVQIPGWGVGHLPGVSGIPLVGKAVTGLTTKTGAGVLQYIWDRAHNSPDIWDADYMRLLMDGNYHKRKHH